MSPRVPPPRLAAPRPVGGARRVVGWLLVGGLVGLLVAVVLPTGLAAWSMSAWFTSQDAGRFDQVEARLTARTVELFHKGERVAAHLRGVGRGRHTTVPEHMPSAHRRHAEWTIERIRRTAAPVCWRRH